MLSAYKHTILSLLATYGSFLMSLRSFRKHFDNTNLRLRMISSAILAPVVLLAVTFGGFIYAGLVIVALVLGLLEWLRLVAPAAHPRLVGIACAMLAVILLCGWIFSTALGAMLAVLLTMALFLLSARDQPERAGWMALGIPYMGGSGLALLGLRGEMTHGSGLVFYLLIAVWGTDIGAFIAGRAIGGAKLAPAISPSKTWAGLYGGIALAMLLGYAVASMLGARHPVVSLLVSPILACVAQLGDLFESYFKRRSGVKESGDLIPGHGGILDRIDGLVFAGVFLFMFQTALGQKLDWF